MLVTFISREKSAVLDRAGVLRWQLLPKLALTVIYISWVCQDSNAITDITNYNMCTAALPFKEVQRKVSHVSKVTNESVTESGAALKLQFLHFEPLDTFPIPRERSQPAIFKHLGSSQTWIKKSQKITLGQRNKLHLHTKPLSLSLSS